MSKPVTGGDLYHLWKIGHMNLPEVKEIYSKAVTVHNDDLRPGDESKFGRVFPAWLNMLGATQFLMERTVLSLNTTSGALDTTIDQYKYVDGQNAKGLTEAGKELQEYVDKKNPPKDETD